MEGLGFGTKKNPIDFDGDLHQNNDLDPGIS